MASRVANPYGAATPLGEGLSSVFNAFLSAPTPEQRAAEAYKLHGLQAGAKRDLAAAGYDTSRTAGQNIQNDALRALPTLDFNAPDAQGRVMQTMNGNYGSLADVFATSKALQPGVDIRSMDPIVYAKTGNAPNTFAGLDITDTTTRRGQDVTAQTQRYGYDTQAATSRANNAADNAVKLQTFNVNTPAGTITTLAPGNPLGKTEITGLPTDNTQKGEIIQAQRNQPGFDPMAPVDAQSSYGSALGTPNEPSGGMSLTVGPDGTVEMTQGQGVKLPTSTISNNLQAQDSIDSYLRTSKELRSVAVADPTLFGATGNVRRFLQAAAGQADMLLQMAGKSDPNVTKDADTVFESVITDLSMAGVQDPTLYDPNLTDIEKLSILAAYQAAAAIAGQEGRGLSNEDFQKFRTIVGDPTAWGSSQQAFVAGLNRLDRLAVAELNARRARLGQQPIDPNAQPTQQQGQEQKSIGGKNYVKINGQWYEMP